MSTEFNTVPNISDLLDRMLLAKRAAEGDREIVGGATWRASKLGSCLRQQYLEFFLKQPKLEEFSALSLRRFEVGHQWGRQFSKWLRELGYVVDEEVQLYDEELDVGAHGDYIVSHGDEAEFGIELKSVSSQWFWNRTNSGETTASPDHLMQTATYKVLWRRHNPDIPWIVLTVSKDDLTLIQDDITETHCDMALDRLRILNEAKVIGPPPCTCLDDWHWRYCGYYAGSDESKKTQHSVPIEGEFYKNGKQKYKKIYKPDGECCVIKN